MIEKTEKRIIIIGFRNVQIEDIDNFLELSKKENFGATVQFFDGPHDPLTFFGPVKVLDAKMSVIEGRMPFGLGLGEVMDEWEE